MPPKDVVVPDAAWRKSRHSIGNGECIEVAPVAQAVMVRDSVDSAGPMLRYSQRTWRAFIASTKTSDSSVLG
jgi:hypothetical protein